MRLGKVPDPVSTSSLTGLYRRDTHCEWKMANTYVHHAFVSYQCPSGSLNENMNAWNHEGADPLTSEMSVSRRMYSKG